jgi:hypothetical protein
MYIAKIMPTTKRQGKAHPRMKVGIGGLLSSTDGKITCVFHEVLGTFEIDTCHHTQGLDLCDLIIRIRFI